MKKAIKKVSKRSKAKPKAKKKIDPNIRQGFLIRLNSEEKRIVVDKAKKFANGNIAAWCRLASQRFVPLKKAA